MRAIIRRADSVCLLQFAGDSATVLQIKQAVAEDSGVPVELQRLVDGAHELADGALVSAAANTTRPRELECVVRTSGGKGGFGAMLRSARGGLDAKKTTNFDAMRDLSGRRSVPFPNRRCSSPGRCLTRSGALSARMRHVNNEKKLKEWIDTAPEREAAAKRCTFRDKSCCIPCHLPCRRLNRTPVAACCWAQGKRVGAAALVTFRPTALTTPLPNPQAHTPVACLRNREALERKRLEAARTRTEAEVTKYARCASNTPHVCAHRGCAFVRGAVAC
jgi:hypothetical protein